MGAFYGNKIKNGDINPQTGKMWSLKDVPSFWRTKAADWLEGN